MSVIRKMVSMLPEDAQFIENQSINLSKFVRNSIKEKREGQSYEVSPSPNQTHQEIDV